MTPLFFGEENKQLFGIYHAANGSNYRSDAILICNPLGFEHEKAHSLILLLAKKLSEMGYHVLRFDYYGTGDSAGQTQDMSITQCIEDAVTAFDELCALAGSKKITVIGLRFGAMIAASLAKQRKVRNLLLWEPILDGAAYLEDLNDLQNRMLNRHPSRLFHSTIRTDSNIGYIGYSLSNSCISELENSHIDNISSEDVLARRLAIKVVCAENENNSMAHESSLLTNAGFYSATSNNDWYAFEKIGEKVLPDPVFQKVVQILE